jgi:hypothetical protein
MQARPFILGAALLALGAESLSAQETVPEAAPQVTQAPRAQRYIPVLGATLGAMAIETTSADRAQVGDRSFGLQLDAGVLVKRHLYLGIDIGGQFLKDHAQFTENTTGGEQKSTASVTYLSAITGFRTGVPKALPVALGFNAGFSTTISRRSIDNCVDCTVNKLDIPGGAFVEPMLLFGRRNAQLRIVDRVYLTGDGMRSVVSAGLEFTARKR